MVQVGQQLSLFWAKTVDEKVKRDDKFCWRKCQQITDFLTIFLIIWFLLTHENLDSWNLGDLGLLPFLTGKLDPEILNYSWKKICLLINFIGMMIVTALSHDKHYLGCLSQKHKRIGAVDSCAAVMVTWGHYFAVTCGELTIYTMKPTWKLNRETSCLCSGLSLRPTSITTISLLIILSVCLFFHHCSKTVPRLLKLNFIVQLVKPVYFRSPEWHCSAMVGSTVWYLTSYSTITIIVFIWWCTQEVFHRQGLPVLKFTTYS